MLNHQALYPNPMTSDLITPTSSNDSVTSHASAACSNNSTATTEPCAPSVQLLAYLTEPSPHDDGSLHGRFSADGQHHAADQIGVHEKRAQEAIDRFDKLFGPVVDERYLTRCEQ